MGSKRIWTDMFKVSQDTGMSTYSSFNQGGSAQNEQKNPQTKARWNPKKEQIDILESIFEAGNMNPSRAEIQMIRIRLQEFGEVGDANVFYWFQNRKSRNRKRQRRLNAAKENEDEFSPSIQTNTANPTETNTANPTQVNTANPIQTSRANPIQAMEKSGFPTLSASTSSFPNHQINTANPIQTSRTNPILAMEKSGFPTLSGSTSSFPNHQINTANPIQTSRANPILAMEKSGFPTLSASTSSFPNHQIQQTQQVSADPHINLQQGGILGVDTTYPYKYNSAISSFPQDYSSFLLPETQSYPFNHYQSHEAAIASALTEARPDARVGYGNEDLLSVTINGMKYKAPKGPINVREAFGPNVIMVDTACQIIPTNEHGFSLHGLEEGGDYYVLNKPAGFSEV